MRQHSAKRPQRTAGSFSKGQRLRSSGPGAVPWATPSPWTNRTAAPSNWEVAAGHTLSLSAPWLRQRSPSSGVDTHFNLNPHSWRRNVIQHVTKWCLLKIECKSRFRDFYLGEMDEEVEIIVEIIAPGNWPHLGLRNVKTQEALLMPC